MWNSSSCLLFILGRMNMFDSNILHMAIYALKCGRNNRPNISRGHNLWYWGRLKYLWSCDWISYIYDWLVFESISWYVTNGNASSDEQAARRACIGSLPFQIHREQQTEYNLIIFHRKWLEKNRQRFSKLISFFINNDQLYIYPIDKIRNILAIVQWKMILLFCMS